VSRWGHNSHSQSVHFRGWVEDAGGSQGACALRTSFSSDRLWEQKKGHATTTCVTSHHFKLNNNSLRGSRIWTPALQSEHLRTLSGSTGINHPNWRAWRKKKKKNGFEENFVCYQQNMETRRSQRRTQIYTNGWHFTCFPNVYTNVALMLICAAFPFVQPSPRWFLSSYFHIISKADLVPKHNAMKTYGEWM
jgi:hypothetical protein